MRTVVITGASRGIGAGIARYFDACGDRVIVNYHRSESQALSLVKTLSNAVPFRADVSDSAQANALLAFAAQFGTVDVLVCNAGVSLLRQIQDVTDEEYDRVFSVNMKGVFHAIRAAVPQMLSAHRGSIVAVSSMWGQSGASCESVYAASKAAVIGFVRSLAAELGPSGIRVNAVAPGLIDTDMNRNLGKDTVRSLVEDTPLGRIGTPEDVAKAVGFLASDDASFLTGQVLGIDGGFLL